MRRLLGLMLMLLLLVSCQQKGSDKATAPVNTDPINVVAPTTIRVQDAHWQTGPWRLTFDFEHTTALPKVNKGMLNLTLERKPEDSYLANLPETVRYVHIRDIHNLTFAVDDEDKTVRLPEWLAHSKHVIQFAEVPLERVVVFNPAYPWLQQTRSGYYHLYPGDTVGIELKWPIDKEVANTALKQMLSATPHKINWIADNQVHVTVLGKNELALDFGGIPDVYGCTPGSCYEGPGLSFTLKVSNSELFAVNLASGKEEKVSVPVPVSGISGFSAGGKVLNTYLALAHYTEVSSRFSMYEYTYDLTTGQLKPTDMPYTTAHNYANTMSEADKVLRPLCEAQGLSFYRQTMSPSGGKAATITGYGPESAMLILDTRTGGLATWPLGNDYPLGSCRPIDPLFWSYDERYVIYDSMPSGGSEAVIYRLDTTTGERVKLGSGYIRSVSPYSEHMIIVQVDRNEYDKILATTLCLVDFEGNKTPLLDVGGGATWPESGPWVGSERVVFNRQTGDGWEWYYYNIATAEWGTPSPGRVLAYCITTDRLYIQK